MDLSGLERLADCEWRLPPTDAMRVPGMIYCCEAMLASMGDPILAQLRTVARLPGVCQAVYAMPDVRLGYGFPVGSVAAFDPDEGGVVAVSGVGFDIGGGTRILTTGLTASDVERARQPLNEALHALLTGTVARAGPALLADTALDRMLEGGAAWAVGEGCGDPRDLSRIEERGAIAGARPDWVSSGARQRWRQEAGAAIGGDRRVEIQLVAEIHDSAAAAAFGLAAGDVVVSIHGGSNGLGHQISMEFLRDMALAATRRAVALSDRELACAPIHSPLGERYLGALRAGINCALASRQIAGDLVGGAFARLFPRVATSLLFDVSHNTCRLEQHDIDGVRRNVYVHRKGAPRALPPGHPELPPAFRATGQPVFAGDEAGDVSYVLRGVPGNLARGFGSACLAARRSESGDDMAEAIAATEAAGLAARVARLETLLRIRG